MKHAPTPALVFLAVLATGAVTSLAGAEPLRDGKRFDPGAVMTTRAPGAPEALDAMAGHLGSWNVAFETFADDSLLHTGQGAAVITFLNRGHGYHERFHCPDFDGAGTERGTVSFLVYNGAGNRWLLGVADDFAENVTVYDGEFVGEDLVLATAIRRLGGTRVTRYRASFTDRSADAFTFLLEASTNDGSTWSKLRRRTYTRRTDVPDWFTPGSDHGVPAPDRPEGAEAFDFLIGEFNENHWMKFPNGQEGRWPVSGTAIHTLNGKAVMEFAWFDVDPNLPDAATTIVRIYNRAMRRWESMYTTNRFNGILYFGGAQEENRIVLGQFESTAADRPMPRWIFHNISPIGYSWHAESSTDRGATWTTTWTIEATRTAP